MREGELVRILKYTLKINVFQEEEKLGKFVEENVKRWELRSKQWSRGSPPRAPPSQLSLARRERLRPRGEEVEVEGTGTAPMARPGGPAGANEGLQGAGG